MPSYTLQEYIRARSAEIAKLLKDTEIMGEPVDDTNIVLAAYRLGAHDERKSRIDMAARMKKNNCRMVDKWD